MMLREATSQDISFRRPRKTVALLFDSLRTGHGNPLYFNKGIKINHRLPVSSSPSL